MLQFYFWFNMQTNKSYNQLCNVIIAVGVNVASMHTMKTQRPTTMLSDVKHLVTTGGTLNLPNDEGVTLVI